MRVRAPPRSSNASRGCTSLARSPTRSSQARRRACLREPSAGTPPPGGHRSGVMAVLLGSRESISGTVYGTVIVMATIATAGKGGLHPWEVLATTIAAVLVLWVAHVYADGLEESIQAGHRLDWPELAAVARHEWSIAMAAFPPGILLVLGGLGVFEAGTAIWLALGAGLLVLGVQGIRYARVERLSGVATLFTVTLNLALGLVIVLLKALVSH